MLVKTYGAAVYGIEAQLITIEVIVTSGMRYYIVGLPDAVVRESLQRIECALTALRWHMPRQKIVVNLAPAYLRKEGSAFDLSIAIGILAASGQLSFQLIQGYLFLGELSLDGGLLPVKGALSMVLMARSQGLRGVFVPAANIQEAAIVEGVLLFAVSSLADVVEVLECSNPESLAYKTVEVLRDPPVAPSEGLDFADVKGQVAAKRALEVAAAGGHNILLVGSPGSGKSMLAGLLPTILPPMSPSQVLQTTQLYSVAGKLDAEQQICLNRPFRAPHHTITATALVGGGVYPMPGEVSLAHHGVLFLDELSEFKRSVLEVLRQPLESGSMFISRLHHSTVYPARFILVGAMNPCPCGFLNHPQKECTCGSSTKRHYLGRISGPLLDRIDMHLDVNPVSFEELCDVRQSETSEEIQRRVITARSVQAKRFLDDNMTNAQMDHRQLRRYVSLQAKAGQLLGQAMMQFGFSARAYDRILKVARTIADLEAEAEVSIKHVAEAIQYRSLDREAWFE